MMVGCPSVKVPVLSKARAEIRPVFSSATASRMRMPRRAAALIPAIRATGVANPMAQGQATMSTEQKAATASFIGDRLASGCQSRGVRVDCQSRSVSGAQIQPAAARQAMTTTTGTKMELTRSARRWMEARLD